MKAGSSSDRKADPVRKAIAPVLKVEVSDDEVEVLESFPMTPT